MTEEEYKRYIADIFLLHARERFGQMLGYLCEKSLLSQREIGRRAVRYRSYLKEKGYLPSEGSTKALDYTGISKVIYAKVVPSYAQIYIWLHVIKEQLKSEEYAKECMKVHEPVFVLEEDFETDMWHLALFGTSREVVEAYKRHEHTIY